VLAKLPRGEVDLESPEADTVNVICDAATWQAFLKAHNLPSTYAAITDWMGERIFIGDVAIKHSTLLPKVVKHELEHLRCRCSLGEAPIQ